MKIEIEMEELEQKILERLSEKFVEVVEKHGLDDDIYADYERPKKSKAAKMANRAYGGTNGK